jgi:hypothetical protein
MNREDMIKELKRLIEEREQMLKRLDKNRYEIFQLKKKIENYRGGSNEGRMREMWL